MLPALLKKRVKSSGLLALHAFHPATLQPPCRCLDAPWSRRLEAAALYHWLPAVSPMREQIKRVVSFYACAPPVLWRRLRERDSRCDAGKFCIVSPFFSDQTRARDGKSSDPQQLCSSPPPLKKLPKPIPSRHSFHPPMNPFLVDAHASWYIRVKLASNLGAINCKYFLLYSIPKIWGGESSSNLV